MRGIYQSVKDWDFNPDLAYVFDNLIYVSPDSSLQVKHSGLVPFPMILCRGPTTLNLPQGQISTWLRLEGDSSAYITWRNQSPLGEANADNCYLLEFPHSPVGMQMLYRKNGVSTQISSFAPTVSIGTWHLYSLTWIISGTDMLVWLQKYNEVTGEWVDVLPIIHVHGNLWADSPINRVGLGTLGGFPTQWVWFDDTAIYGVAP